MKRAINTFLLTAAALACMAQTPSAPVEMPVTPAMANAASVAGDEFSVNGVNYEVISDTDHTCRTKQMDGWYSGNNAEGDIVIPEKVAKDGVEYTVVAVGQGSFYSNSKLTGIVLPSTVKSIGKEAFNQCGKLVSITLPEGLTTIGDMAFQSTHITAIDIPASVAVIGTNPFSMCYRLAEITVNAQNPAYVMDGNILYSKDATGARTGVVTCLTATTGDIVIPQTVKTIGARAFYNCSQITSVTIPEGVISIGERAFNSNYKVTSFTVPASVTEIGEYAFASNMKLKTIEFRGGITALGDNILSDCTVLESVTIPATVTSIGQNAFAKCTALTQIQLPPALKSVGYKAFDNCGITSLVFPETMTEIGEYALSGCKSLTSVNIPANIRTIPKGLFNGCHGFETYTIPGHVTAIGDYAFSSCTGLKSIQIPESITTIGMGVFMACWSLENIEIPDWITTLGEMAFANCKNATTLKIGNKITTISKEAFRDCAALTAVIIPNSVTSIEKSAFSKCSSLANVDLGNSVASIDQYAFGYCTSLNSITLPLSVLTLAEKAFYHSHELKDVYVLNPEPFEIPAGAFYCDPYNKYAQDYIYKHATLHVPAASLEAYQSATPWKNFSAFEALPSVALTSIPGAVYGDAAIDLAAYSPAEAQLVYKSSNPGVAAIDGNILTINGAGNVIITAERGAGMPVYTIIENPERTLTVAKADLNVTARSYTVTQGDALPDFALDFAGFVNDDTAADLEVLPAVFCPVSNTSAAGTFTLTPEGGVDNNYNFIYHDGALTVTAPVGIDAMEAGTLNVKVANGEIVITGVPEGSMTEIYNAAGNILARIAANGGEVRFAPEASGIYFIKLNNNVKKVVL